MTTQYTGTAYRAHDPKWAFNPTSGKGAEQHGGRFNPKGLPALYLGLSLEGAMAEAMQGFTEKMEPLLVCCYEINAPNILYLSTPAERKLASVFEDEISCPWHLQLATGKTPDSWILQQRLSGSGVSGIIVPSFAPSAKQTHFNLVLWKWDASSISVVDNDNRIPIDQKSWTW